MREVKQKFKIGMNPEPEIVTFRDFKKPRQSFRTPNVPIAMTSFPPLPFRSHSHFHHNVTSNNHIHNSRINQFLQPFLEVPVSVFLMIIRNATQNVL